MMLQYSVKLFFTFLTIIFLSCEEATQKSIDDNSPPQCVILYPDDGQSISGEIVIQARAVDNLGTKYVEFYINQEKVHVDSTSNNDDTYTYRWNTVTSSSMLNLNQTYAEDEYHFISIIAYDLSGNSYATPPLKVGLIILIMNHPMLLYLNLFKANLWKAMLTSL